MTIRVVTDSTCDLPADVVEKHHITVIPMFINAGGREYRDGIDLTRQEFFERLPEFKPSPTTAAPGPEIFRQTYERLAAEGATAVLSIHISEKLSATMNIVGQAARETTVVPVTALDSRQLSLGTGFQVLAAAQAAAEGHSLSEILAMLKELVSRIRVFAALDTLEFLRRSGRMNLAVSTLGSLLQIKPFLKMFDGNPTAERIRTRKGAMRHLVELLEEAAPFERVALLHSRAAERAHAMLDEVRHLLPQGNIWVEEINPVLGAHLGPGVIGFACIQKKEKGLA